MIIAFGTNKRDRLVSEIAEAIHDRVDSGIKARIQDLQTVGELSETINTLKQEIAELNINRDREQEKHERTEREIEHKVGLHKKQVEHEIKQAREETRLEVQKDNLQAERDRFENEMKFMRERMEKEVTYLQSIMEKILKRLPSAEILAEIGGNRSDVR